MKIADMDQIRSALAIAGMSSVPSISPGRKSDSSSVAVARIAYVFKDSNIEPILSITGGLNKSNPFAVVGRHRFCSTAQAAITMFFCPIGEGGQDSSKKK
jgi:hypothetical protein